MLLQVLVVGEGIDIEMIEGAPVLIVSFSPGRRVQAGDEKPETPTTTGVDPWYVGHNFGYTPDE